MKKLFLLIIFALGVVLAEPVVGNAYVISALGIKNYPNDVDYVSGDTSVSGNANYVLAPQVIIYQEGLSYVGSYTPFTGCLSSKHYTNGAPDGMCITGIVNDLTTGGVDKALSAEQGKVLNDKVANLQSITRINYLKPTIKTQTVNGITITNNGDGTYTLNGTATDWSFINLTPYKKYKGGAYRLVGCPKGGNDDWNLYMYDQTDNTDFGFDHGDGSTFELIEGHAYVTVIRIKTGVTFNNAVFKPMLTTDLDATYDDFVPYQDSLATNQSIIDATRINYLRPTLQTTTMNGVTITNNGNGTYTLNGTATSTFHIGILWDIKVSGQYKLIGCPEGGSEETYRLVLHNTSFSWATVDYGNGTVFNINETCHLQLYINTGVPLNNLVFKPMITNDLSATYDNFVSFDNSLVTGANSGLKMDLLWENTSPSSAFNSQTINVINNNYVFYYITYRRKSTDSGSTNTFSLIKVGGTDHPTTEYARKIFYREVSTSNSVISFSNGGYADSYGGVSTQDSTVMVPVYIYGIK